MRIHVTSLRWKLAVGGGRGCHEWPVAGASLQRVGRVTHLAEATRWWGAKLIHSIDSHGESSCFPVPVIVDLHAG
jgi:hypothetical protein